MTTDQPPVVPGYRLETVLGHGASGPVWRASRLASGSQSDRYAVKVLASGTPGLGEDVMLRAASLEHLVRVREVVDLPDGRRALVTDLYDGGTLGDVVAARGRLSPGELVTALAPVAGVLGRLHALGIVHADLAPGNVLFDRSGRPMLADLGVAQVLGAPRDPAGSAGFAAPEVIEGALPGPAADVYGLGALAWYALTGAPPDPIGMRGPLADLVPPAYRDSGVLAIVAEALRSRPGDRPDADTVAVGLFDAATAEPIPVVAAGESEVSVLTHRIRELATADRVGSPEPTPAGRRPLARRGRHAARVPRRGLVLGVAAAVVLLVALAAVSGRLAPAAAERGPAPATASARPATPLSRAEAIATDPQALVQALAEARAGLWEGGLVAGLGEVDAPGSAAWRADAEAVGALQRSGRHYEGLTLTARSVRVVSREPARGTLEVVVDTGPYAVVGPDGREERPAQAGTPVLLDVMYTTAGWRVAAVRSVPDAKAAA